MGREDFTAEVEDLMRMQRETMDFCRMYLDSNNNILTNTTKNEQLIFYKTVWNPDIVITYKECAHMFSKTGLRDEIRWQYDNNPKMVKQPRPPDNKPVGC